MSLPHYLISSPSEVPEHIRSHNVLNLLLKNRWENGYIESFNDKLRGELVDRAICTLLEEVKVLMAQGRREYHQIH
jgi:hypothetical protein